MAAVEVLLGTRAVASLIRERKTHQLPSLIQTGRGEGMQLLDDALVALVRSGVVTPEEASRFTDTAMSQPKSGAEAVGPAASTVAEHASMRTRREVPGTARRPQR